MVDTSKNSWVQITEAILISDDFFLAIDGSNLWYDIFLV